MRVLFSTFVFFVTLSFFQALLRAEESAPIQVPKVHLIEGKKVVKKKPAKRIEVLLGRISGTIQIRRGKKMLKAGAETFLKLGDEVWVRRDSSASIWIEKSVVDLGKHTVFRVEGPGRYRLLYGSMRGLVPKDDRHRYVFKTANAEVRSPKGEFFLHALKDKETFEQKNAGHEAPLPELADLLTSIQKDQGFLSQVTGLSGTLSVIPKKGKSQNLYRGEYLKIIGTSSGVFPKRIEVKEAQAMADRYGIVVTH